LSEWNKLPSNHNLTELYMVYTLLCNPEIWYSQNICINMNFRCLIFGEKKHEHATMTILQFIEIPDKLLHRINFNHFSTINNYHLSLQRYYTNIQSYLLLQSVPFLLFCFHGLAITLFVLTPSRFLHFRKYRDLMGNFFNNGPKIFEINCQSSYISYINKHLEKSP
jgi:hypothetical protein